MESGDQYGMWQTTGGKSGKSSLNDRYKQRHSEIASFFCLFFCYLSVTPFLIIFFYHAAPTTILAILAILALSSLIPFMFNRGDVVVVEPVGPLLSAVMLACTTLVFLGSMYLYWAHVQPMRALTMMRQYKGVYPGLPAVGFPDGAFLNFHGAKVDVDKAVSLKSLDAGLNTFCLAPIVNPDITQAQVVQFWAVGVDCCGDKTNGKFECGDVGNSGAKNGVVVQNPSDALFDVIGKYIAPSLVRRDIFQEAIAKSEYTQSSVSGKDAILVQWTRLSKDEVVTAGVWKIVGSCLIIIALSAVMAIFLTRIVHRFNTLRQHHRIRTGMTLRPDGRKQDGDKSVSARLYDFLHKMDDDFEKAELMFGAHMKRAAPSRADMAIMGVLVPYIILILCVIVTTYTGCMRNGHYVYAPFYIVLGLFIVAVMATPHRVITGCFLLLVASVGLYIGFENYNNSMFHYCSVGDRRIYKNVAADSSSTHFQDAGVLKFNAEAYLAQEFSVGFKQRDKVYCAAPIISRSDCVTASSAPSTSATSLLQDQDNAPSSWAPLSLLQRTSRMQLSLDTDTAEEPAQPATAAAQCKPVRVEFWAIGIDCCSERKSFDCDGGKDIHAHTGVIVQPTPDEEPGGRREQFFNAWQQAVAQYDLPTPEHPVLIRWGSEAQKIKDDWAGAARGVILLTALVGLIALIMIGGVSYFVMYRVHVRQQKLEQKGRTRKGGPPPLENRRYEEDSRSIRGTSASSIPGGAARRDQLVV